MSGRPKLICFDWDGTLADSFAKIVDCFTKTAVEMHLNTVPPQAIKQRIGMPLEQLIKEIYGNVNLDKFKQIYHAIQKSQSSAPLFPETKQLLSDLKPAFFIAIISNQSRRQLQQDIHTHRLENYIDSVWSAEDFAPKPSPIMLRHAMSAHQVSPKESWFVGDALADFYASTQAGFAKTLLLQSLPIPSWADRAETISSLNDLYAQLNLLPCE